jgi:uncharacterized DUF497 family protein
MKFEWDEVKSQSNLTKHGVTFEEASEVFADPLHLSLLDHRFEYYEERWITVGQNKERRILVVANLYFDGDLEEVVRIISAREATKNEQRQYEEQR